MTEPNDIQPTSAESGKERRSVPTLIRWKPSEFNLVKFKAQAATGGDVSEYVRIAALDQTPYALSLEERRGLIRMMGELGKIGSNINQLARAANQGQAPESAALFRALQAHTECADQIRFILTNYKPPRQ